MTYQSTSETVRVDLRRSSKKGPRDEESMLGEAKERRLILVGKSGGGKSATGNTILGRKEFNSLMGAKTTTLRCQKGEGNWQNMKISVVDTPAMFDAKVYDDNVRQEIIACVELSQPGPHALILVTQVGRFTSEDAAAAKCVWDIFGAESARHMIVLFTCVEDLGGHPLQEYVEKSDNKKLQQLIRRCGNRICGFNNKAKGDERERQVMELMEMVEKTVFENGRRYYVNWLYQMPNVRDEHVKEFLAGKKTVRERAVRISWSHAEIVMVAISCFLFIAIVIAIVLMVHFL